MLLVRVCYLFATFAPDFHKKSDKRIVNIKLI